MNLNVTEINSLNNTSRVPVPRITTMAHKNRGSLVNTNQPTKKTVTYDDILSSLNMQVVNGKLQIVRNQVAENIKANNIEYFEKKVEENSKKIPNFNQQIQSQYQKQYKTQHETKNFFQNTLNLNEEVKIEEQNYENPEIKQFKKMVALNYIKTLQEKQRIQSVKSTKLMFSNTTPTILARHTDPNRLFRFGRR